MLELEHLQHFTDVKGFFTGDTKTKKYFQQNFSANTEQEIYIKLSSFSVPYLDNLKTGKHELASFIASQDLESLLSEGSPIAVDKLSRFLSNKNDLEFLEFASTYCNWHNQDGFPIYNKDAILLLNKSIVDSSSNNKWSYRDFSDTLRQFRKVNQLEDLNFKELDKFIWLYSKGSHESIA